jgi:hypothetical protein
MRARQEAAIIVMVYRHDKKMNGSTSVIPPLRVG